jgi:hypothetical protein
MGTPLTVMQRAQLRAKTMCADETIDAWWSGRRAVRPATAARLGAAAGELGIVVGTQREEHGGLSVLTRDVDTRGLCRG